MALEFLMYCYSYCYNLIIKKYSFKLLHQNIINIMSLDFKIFVLKTKYF